MVWKVLLVNGVSVIVVGILLLKMHDAQDELDLLEVLKWMLYQNMELRGSFFDQRKPQELYKPPISSVYPPYMVGFRDNYVYLIRHMYLLLHQRMERQIVQSTKSTHQQQAGRQLRHFNREHNIMLDAFIGFLSRLID